MCEYGEIVAVEKWLTAQERSSALSSTSHISDLISPSDESEEEIDITSSSSPSQGTNCCFTQYFSFLRYIASKSMYSIVYSKNKTRAL